MSMIGRTVAAAVLVAALAGCTGGPSDAPPSSSAPPPPSSDTPIVDVVPDVTGLLGAAAATQLADADMTVKFISMSSGAELDADDAANSPVIQTYPAAGSDVHSNRAVSVFVGPDPQASAAPTVSPSPPAATLDLVTDAGLCAADSMLTSLELNDAIAPVLGFSSAPDERTIEQDDAIRAYKNAAFARACPERVS